MVSPTKTARIPHQITQSLCYNTQPKCKVTLQKKPLGFAPSSRNQRRTKRKATLEKSHKPPKYRLILRELREDGSIAPEIYHQEIISEAQAVSGRYIPKLIQWNSQRTDSGLLPLVSRLEKLEGGAR